MIEPGWKVVAADGTEVGRVEEVMGDSGQDIFNGLSIATGILARPRYLPAEEVAEIVEGEVRLKLTADEIERLGEYERPPTSSRVDPGDGSLGKRVESTSRRVPLRQRIASWLGLRGRR
jgi:ribosomal 30S subunit maturation factor RimM